MTRGADQPSRIFNCAFGMPNSFLTTKKWRSNVHSVPVKMKPNFNSLGLKKNSWVSANMLKKIRVGR